MRLVSNGLLTAAVTAAFWMGCANEVESPSLTVESDELKGHTVECPSDVPTPKKGKKEKLYRWCFEFEDGFSECGWSDENVADINGMPVHVSCSADYDSSGYPDKDRPKASLGDPAVLNYSIEKFEVKNDKKKGLQCKVSKSCADDFQGGGTGGEMVTCPDGAQFPKDGEDKPKAWCFTFADGFSECGVADDNDVTINGLDVHISCSAKYDSAGYPSKGEPEQSKGHPAVLDYSITSYEIKKGECKIKKSCQLEETGGPEVTCPDGMTFPADGEDKPKAWCFTFADGFSQCGVSDKNDVTINGLDVHISCSAKYDSDGYPSKGEPEQSKGHPAVSSYSITSYEIKKGECKIKKSCDGDFGPPEPTECEDPTCATLSEATEKGWVEITMSTGPSIDFQNTGPTDICFDYWYFVRAQLAQDGGAGLLDGGSVASTILAPGDTLSFERSATTTPHDDIWWCTEPTQLLLEGAMYEYNGAHYPADLLDIHIHGLGSLNADQIQVAQWDSLKVNASFTVGRHQNAFEVAPGESFHVQLKPVNLANVGAHATVRENVPAGFIASGFSRPPTGITTESDGSKTYTWEVYGEPPVVTHDEDPFKNGNQVWQPVTISYDIQATAAGCTGRVTSALPEVSYWNDRGDWTSTGDPLVIDCCANH